ncbi:MAG: thrombospondin type 3 repeat-containing protein [Planctomycetota bacterium]
MLHHARPAQAAATTIIAALAGAAHAQPELTVSGETIDYSGTFVDRVVPDLPGSIFRFTLFGADGGSATAAGGFECFNAGGRGATVVIDIPVLENQSSRLMPGSTVRAVVGEAGESRSIDGATSFVYAGGGGGTGLLYAPSTSFDLVAVAGGGGGATAVQFLGICTRPDQEGRDAETGTCGGSGNGGGGGAGGCEGNAGNSVGTIIGGITGGGGGALFGAGPQGGGAGLSVGGAGGVNPNAAGEDNPRGGFGYGGGGSARAGGGGGGGYSGGGAGGTEFAGGGGGSFADASFHVGSSTPTIVTGSPGVSNGRLSYQIVGQTHDEGSGAISLNQAQTRLTGSTIGATADGSTTFCFGPDAVPLPNVWYNYSNNTNDVQILRFSNGVGADRISIFRVLSCVGSGTNAATATLQPGDFVRISIESDDDTFALDLSIEADSDNDGIPNSQDVCQGFDDNADADGDGVPDGCDLCPGADDTIDSDGNGFPDACEEDCDGDGVPNDLDTTVDVSNAIPLGVIGEPSLILSLSLCFSGTDFDTTMALWDASGSLLASSDDVFLCNGASGIDGTFPAGSYFLAVAGAPLTFDGSQPFSIAWDANQCPVGGNYEMDYGNLGRPRQRLTASVAPSMIDVYSFEIAVPRLCADQNDDGLVTTADFNAWVLNFNAGDLAADTNQDGILSPADFNAWILAFNQGTSGPTCSP